MADVLLVGAGAVGAPIAAWLATSGHRVRVLARGATADALEARGITWHAADTEGSRSTTAVEVVRSLAGTARPDLVLLGVKTAALDEVASTLRDAYGADLLVVGLQNGIEVLRVLPGAFRRSVLALVHFNGWIEAPGVYGVQRKGALVVAPMGRASDADAAFVAEVLASATTVVRAARARDAALCKMVVNLTGSLQTLTAFHAVPPDDPDALQALLSRLLAEGVATIRAAGAEEVRVPGTPSWLVLRASASLPRPLTRPIFRKNVGKMRISSLAQDVARGARAEDTELDAIHGELVRLAGAFDVDARVGRTVLRLLQERLARPPFEPMTVSALARAVREERRG